MKRLTLVRHATAEWKNPEASDFERALTRRGEAEAEALGKHLLAQDLVPQLLVSSSARRARQTTDHLARELSLSQQSVKFDENLYLASADVILRVARSPGPKLQHLMIVGHNPGLSELCELLAPNGGIAELGTAVACTMTFDVDSWGDVTHGLAAEARCEARSPKLFGLWT